jgi:hypothetical protein
MSENIPYEEYLQGLCQWNCPAVFSVFTIAETHSHIEIIIFNI